MAEFDIAIRNKPVALDIEYVVKIKNIYIQ